MVETTLEMLKRQLDTENDVSSLSHISADFYPKISAYSQKLRRSASSGNSEATNRLITRQVEMIRSMITQLLNIRARKATEQNSFGQLVPEERYVCSAQRKFQTRFNTFVEAISAGQPSFIEFAHRNEATRNVTVRFTKHVDELVGMDLKHYGPFEADDLASIPAANADILIMAGDAVEVLTREDS